ncbi:MAG TPA: Spy/CpxP family protein refolding chaperone [Oscillatoriaceae cyanobacterium]
MSFHAKRRGMLVAALITALLAGCGFRQPIAPAPVGNPDDSATTYEVQQADPADGTTADPADGAMHRHNPLACLDKLDLTADQRAKIDAIRAQGSTDLTRADIQAWGAQFTTLMQADSVDRAALRSLLTEVLDKLQAHTTAMVDQLVQIRDVLTDDQRKQAAVMLLDRSSRGGDGWRGHHHWRDGMREDGKDGLGLSREQRAAFRWKWRFSHRRLRAAIASFMLTGDRAALVDAVTIPNQSDTIDRMVTVLAGLTADQRATLLRKMMRHHHMAGTQPSTAPEPAAPATTTAAPASGTASAAATP